MPPATVTLPSKPLPAPPGPKVLAPRHTIITDYRDMGRYKLPMSNGRPAWRVMLEQIGYPMPVLMLDFETYFDNNFHMNTRKKTGVPTVRYVNDPRFEVLGISELRVETDFPNLDMARWINGIDDTRAYLEGLQAEFGDELEGCTVVAHNAKFEAAVFSWYFGFYPKYIIDTIDLGRHWYTRRSQALKDLCIAYNLVEKGNTSEFSGWSNRTRIHMQKPYRGKARPPIVQAPMTPDQQQALGEYAINDGLRQWNLFTILMPLVSTPETEFPLMKHTLDMYIQPRLMFDNELAEQLKIDMQAEATTAFNQAYNVLNTHLTPICMQEYRELAALPQPTPEQIRRGACLELTPLGDTITREVLSLDTSFEYLMFEVLRQAGEDPAAFTKHAKNKKGYKLAIAKDDPEYTKLMEHPNDQVRLLMQARVAVKSWPTHIERINSMQTMANSVGGFMPIPLKYHGALPGRYAGDDGVNQQNLGSRGHKLVSKVRELLMAPPGKELVIADASQIQARVLAWIAGQWDLVEKFANDREVYCEFASAVLQRHIRKPIDERYWVEQGCIPAVEAYYKWARNQIGKTGILASGFGMGKDKCLVYGKGEFNLETAGKIISTYREKHPCIETFWHDIEAAFIYTLKYGKPCSLPRGIRFYQTDEVDVIIVLPSGRELKYHKCRLKPGKYGGESLYLWDGRTHTWKPIWGGTLTENVVMAMERDVITSASLELAEEEVHQVHDEIILICDEGEGEALLDRACKLLSTRPSWGPELPLNAEGKVTKRYGDH